MVTGHPPGLLSCALGYAARGWPVFPCRPGSKEPATRHGFHDASTDTERIRAWWRDRPAANVAIATGWPGPDVLDVDDHGDAGNGYPAYRRLALAGLVGGALAIVSTPHAGLHLYFPGTGQASGRLTRHHLDFKTVGGYVLAPPSRVGDARYGVLTESGAGASVLNWAAVTDLLEPERALPSQDRPGRPGDTRRLVAWVARLEEGNRNCGLFWAACRAIEAGHVHLLTDLATAAAVTGLPDDEIGRTVASALRSAVRPAD